MTGLLPPDHPQAPRYWRYEIGGELRPAMERYLLNEPARPGDVSLIRAYLRQWIDSPVWDGGVDGETRNALDGLRTRVHDLHNRLQVDMWLELALELGINPL